MGSVIETDGRDHVCGAFPAVAWFIRIVPATFGGTASGFVAADEREACEMAVEEIARKYQHEHNSSKETIADECAAAIRVRGML